jgi:hypothetical protein
MRIAELDNAAERRWLSSDDRLRLLGMDQRRCRGRGGRVPRYCSDKCRRHVERRRKRHFKHGRLLLPLWFEKCRCIEGRNPKCPHHKAPDACQVQENIWGY